jgi:hypothetical protein
VNAGNDAVLGQQQTQEPNYTLVLSVSRLEQLFNAAGALPFREVADNLMDIRAQVGKQNEERMKAAAELEQARAASMQRPGGDAAEPAADEPVGAGYVNQDLGVSTAQKRVEFGRHLLRSAEEHRRSGAGSLDVTPAQGETPASDYAAATSLISRAVHHLDESLPGGQAQRTATAYAALKMGVELLGEWLNRRGIAS